MVEVLYFLAGFMAALVIYFFVHKESHAILVELEAKYARLLAIVEAWQKKL